VHHTTDEQTVVAVAGADVVRPDAALQSAAWMEAGYAVETIVRRRFNTARVFVLSSNRT